MNFKDTEWKKLGEPHSVDLDGVELKFDGRNILANADERQVAAVRASALRIGRFLEIEVPAPPPPPTPTVAPAPPPTPTPAKDAQ